MRATSVGLVLFLLAGATPALAESKSDLTANQRAILTLAEKSQCAAHKWKWKKGADRAPVGFIKGVALTFAKSYCEHRAGGSSAVAVMQQPLGSAMRDALRDYQSIATIPSATALQRLESVYTLALGLGMRESSGRTTISAPYDSANPNPDSSTGEAGLYQTSYNSTSKSEWLPKLTGQYRHAPEKCYFDVFTEGTGTKITPPIGSGEGAEFQQLTKSCPAFATEYVMVMMRVSRRHYGPLKIHSAEFENKCLAMFRAIEPIVQCP